MDLLRVARQACQALFFPQSCVICDRWVCNPDFSPLCKLCLDNLESIQGVVCDRCGCPLPGSVEAALCGRCSTELAPLFSSVRSWGLYQGHLREIIRKFKFEGFQQLAHPLAFLLKLCLEKYELGDGVDWLVPVPVHPARKQQRGYDHILLLASSLSRQTGVPVFHGLCRTRDTSPQFGLDFHARQQNVQGAFRLKDHIPVRNGGVILLDDVLTTGATVFEIGRVLQRHAPDTSVTVLSVARVSLLYSSL